MIEPSSPGAGEQWTFAGLAALLALLWLSTLSARPLFNPDEGRYAEIPREMLGGGDWVIPHLNGLAYIEKPPLQYWATALSYRAFGLNEFAARLYTALTALGTVALVFTLGRRLWGAPAAWRAAAVLPGMFMFLVLGQLLSLDMSLTFYLTLSLAGFVSAQLSPKPGRWMLLAWAGAALGVLTKGLVAAAIPVAVLILYSLYARDFAPWRRLSLRWGLPLFLAITVPWHWLAARRAADFLQFFFVHEHLARYLTPVADREEPWWFFGAVFLVGSLPWTLSALRVLGSGWRRRPPGQSDGPAAGGAAGADDGALRDCAPDEDAPGAGGAVANRGTGVGGRFQPALFLWIWAVFIGVFFSLSDSKLMPYILPALPAVALLIGRLPAATLRRDMKFTAILTLTAGMGFGLASLNWAALIASSSRIEYFLPLAGTLGEIALLLLVSAAFVLVRCARDATRGVVFLGAGWCLAWLLLMRGAASAAPVYSGLDLARGLPEEARTAPFYSVRTYDQSFVFYLRRTVTVVAYRGELDYGLQHAPGAEIADVEQFVRLWPSHAQAFAVMENRMFDDLKSRGLPMRIVARNADRIVVARQ